jgi:arginase family enzyme
MPGSIGRDSFELSEDRVLPHVVPRVASDGAPQPSKSFGNGRNGAPHGALGQGDLDAGGVQRNPRDRGDPTIVTDKSSWSPVDGISDEGDVGVARMHPQLMRPTGSWRKGQEHGTRRPCHDPRDARGGGRVPPTDLPVTRIGRLANGCIPHVNARGQTSPADGDIPSAIGPFLAGPRQSLAACLRLREEHDAAHVAIQARRGHPDAGIAPELGHDVPRERVGLAALVGNRHHPGGLFQGDDVVVLEQDRKDDGVIIRGGGGNRHANPQDQGRLRVLGSNTVDEDPAIGDGLGISACPSNELPQRRRIARPNGPDDVVLRRKVHASMLPFHGHGMDAIRELELLLRPAGGGIYLVSTGRAEQLALQRRLYDARTDADVAERFRQTLERVADARVAILGIPSDVGAGFQRGANLAPSVLRRSLLDVVPELPELFRQQGVVDVGDVFVVPQLLHDSMLSDAQLNASRAALYPDEMPAVRSTLPVSPLSLAERALDLLLTMNPNLVPFVLGGDHSCAWPVVASLARKRQGLAVVQVDAHTDLLAERLGVKYCFATWSYHANDLLGRDGRLVQFGIRATRHPRSHWEGSLGVMQLWANECRANPDKALDDAVRHLESIGTKCVYFSNDIDGTDIFHAEATGTPEADGLSPEFVRELIRRLASKFSIVAADLMEVAPKLGPDAEARTRTLRTALAYIVESLRAVGVLLPSTVDERIANARID